MSIDIRKFCGDRVRSYLENPFLFNGKLIGTNGHIMVCLDDCPADAPTITEVGAPKTFGSLIEKHLTHPHSDTWQRIAGKVPPYDRPECRTCGGVGEVECNYGHDHECPSCDGCGLVRVSIQFAETYFDAKYIQLIAELPDAELSVAHDNGASAFRFAGGEGRVMPMRYACETNIVWPAEG